MSGAIQNDLRHNLESEFGTACCDRYWAILEELFDETGYRDNLGALQRYRTEHRPMFACFPYRHTW